MEAPPCLIEEFKVLCNGHDILVALPLPAHLEVAEDLARDVGFERSLYQRTETLFGLLKIGVLRGYIEKPETLELTEERSEEHTSELQSRSDLVCRLLLEKKKKKRN